MELDLFSSSADFSFENKEKTEENKVSMAQRSEMETVNKEKTDNIIEAEMELKELKKEDIIESCVKYFKGDALAADVWFNKYALRAHPYHGANSNGMRSLHSLNGNEWHALACAH